MRNLATLAATLLTMALLSSGTVSAAAPQTSTQATPPIAASKTMQERKDLRTLAKRSAAAKKLKAEVDKQNAAKSKQAK